MYQWRNAGNGLRLAPLSNPAVGDVTITTYRVANCLTGVPPEPCRKKVGV